MGPMDGSELHRVKLTSERQVAKRVALIARQKLIDEQLERFKDPTAGPGAIFFTLSVAIQVAARCCGHLRAAATFAAHCSNEHHFVGAPQAAPRIRARSGTR